MFHMKYLLISILCILVSIEAFSQELVVKSFRLNESDLSARTQKRLDANGNICALIKVESIPVCEFGGYVIGDVEKKMGAYWVYVCAKNPITKKLIVSSDNFQPLEVEFSQFGISNIESGSTYTLRIESVNKNGFNILGGHKYVDLGLSVYWAECNLGALKPQDPGDKYAWGVNFSTNDTISKDIKNITGTKYDAVSQLWGEEWRMPTSSELSELLSVCIVYEDRENDIDGKRFIGPNGNTIFIPYTSKIKYSHDPSVLENYTSLWSGEKNKKYRLRIGYRPIILEMQSLSGNYIRPFGGEKAERYCRPVFNKPNNLRDENIWENPTNNRYLVKGQVVYSAKGEKPITTAVNIYDNRSGKFLQQIINDKGLFEIWVNKDQELRFEFNNDKEQKPTIIKVSPIMKVGMLYIPTFGLG